MFGVISMKREFHNGIFSAFILAMFGAGCVISVAAVISQARRRATPRLRLFGFLLLGQRIINTILLFGVIAALVIVSIKHPELSKGGFKLTDLHWFKLLQWVLIAMDAGLIAFGVAAQLGHRRAAASGAFQAAG